MKIAMILGSVREGRKTDRLAYYLLERLEAEPGIEPVMLDLKEQVLPFYAHRWREQDPQDPTLAAVGAELARADAMILISPEYHGSYTGVLKNALDHYWDEFKRKPIGVVATASGRMGGINASTEMQQLVLSLGGFPMPYKLIVPFIADAFTPERQPAQPAVQTAVDTFVREFVWFARALTYAKQTTLS
ncbi:MAG: NAD(P)H-dependent oxidoreductase [Bacteroidia bacterium]|nr:NAD(P)H-dependent oxidoreductase [Bacteroidia bacterium]